MLVCNTAVLQDAGPGYRNVIGLPRGVRSPLFPILQAANKDGMELRDASVNSTFNASSNAGGGKGEVVEEGDEINVVWVVDSTARPFYRAEVYHQFHNGLGKAFPASYTRDLKTTALQSGIIGGTGCPELPF
jgi:hypothetical protein